MRSFVQVRTVGEQRPQRVELVVGGEAVQERLVALLEDPLDPRLHGALAVLAEERSELLGELDAWPSSAALRAPSTSSARSPAQLALDPLDASGSCLELLAVLAGQALELALDVVDLGRDLLAVEHPGADLDRLRDRVRAGSDRTRRAARTTPGGALVGDRQLLDHEPVVERADGALGAWIERELWLLGGFHGTHEGSRGPGRNLTPHRARAAEYDSRSSQPTAEGLTWP